MYSLIMANSTKSLLRSRTAAGILSSLALIAIVLGLLHGGIVEPPDEAIDTADQGDEPGDRPDVLVPWSRVDQLSTALLDLNLWQIETSSPGGTTDGPGAIEIVGEDVIIGNSTGAFFLVQLKGEKTTLSRLPLSIDLHIEEATAFIREILDKPNGKHPPRITDLHYLENRNELAAAYVHWDGERQCEAMRVSVVDVADGWQGLSRSSWRTVFESVPCFEFVSSNHESGGRLWQIAPEKLLMTIGEFGKNWEHKGKFLPQEPSNHFGKVVEIDLGRGTAEIHSVGHRNPQGLTVDSAGRSWLTEHGPQGGDELNLIVKDGNYGWPHETLGTAYNSRDWPLSEHQGRHDVFQEPVFAWVLAIGVSNLIEVQNFHPRWDGDLIVTSLNGGSLHRLRLEGDRVLYEERIHIGKRIRDIGRTDDGAIVLWTDQGQIMIISPEKLPNEIEQTIVDLDPATQDVLARCRECHLFAAYPDDENRISLWRILDRKAAAAESALYSDDLRNWQGAWTERNLDRFLADPSAMIPDTGMAGEGVPDPDRRAAVLEFLKTLR